MYVLYICVCFSLKKRQSLQNYLIAQVEGRHNGIRICIVASVDNMKKLGKKSQKMLKNLYKRSLAKIIIYKNYEFFLNYRKKCNQK